MQASAESAGKTETVRKPWALRVLPTVSWTLVAILGSIIFILPFLWMISTSVKPRWEQLIMPPQWIPSRFVWENYSDPFTSRPFPTWYLNTLTLVFLNVIGSTLSSSLVAFAFARIQFRGRGILFLIVLSTMMLPGQVTLIPTYILFTRLGWVDSLRPLIVPNFFGVPFYIFLLRQFYMTINRELDDAAEIDGCSLFGVYWRIILPLSKSALGVVAIYEFTFRWNDFFGPLIYINTPIKAPVALGLRFFQTRFDPQIGPTMAMTFVSIIPLLLVFYMAQRYFVQGIVMTGLKG
jgi:ABC-type glycerol-3-phosphate transport system permease component